MKKINNKSIFFGLKILYIFVFSILFVPNLVSADYAVYNGASLNQASVNTTWQIVYSISPSFANKSIGAKNVTITGEGFLPTSVARVNGSDRATTFIDGSHLLVRLNPNDTYRTDGGFYISVFDSAAVNGRYSNSAYFTVNAPVTTTNTNNNNNYSSSTTSYNDTNNNYSNTSETTTDTNTNTTDENYSNLASNAVFGSNSFLPSGLIQWVIFAIIILLIVILVRKIFGAKQNYDEAPMKHA